MILYTEKQFRNLFQSEQEDYLRNESFSKEEFSEYLDWYYQERYYNETAE